MSDSTTSATRAGIDIVDLAIAQLRAEAKSHSKLGLAFNVLGLLFLILSLTMDFILKNAPRWLGPMLGGMGVGFLAGAIWCMSHAFCLRRIALRCKTDNLLPFSQLIVSFEKKQEPSIINSLDKPIVLLPKNIEFNLSDGERAHALEVLRDTFGIFWYHVHVRIDNNVMITTRSMQIQQEVPKTEEV